MSRGHHGPVSQIMVGLRVVGIVGLEEALRVTRDEAPEGREDTVERLLELVSASNYVPAPPPADYRDALWREYRRQLGEDIRELYSPLDVVVLGPPDRDREMFVEMLRSILAEYELRPAIAYGPPDGDGPYPRLLIDGETVARGLKARHVFKQRIRKRISYW